MVLRFARACGSSDGAKNRFCGVIGRHAQREPPASAEPVVVLRPILSPLVPVSPGPACNHRWPVSPSNKPGDLAGAISVTAAPKTIPARAPSRDSRRTADATPGSSDRPGLSGLAIGALETWL